MNEITIFQVFGAFLSIVGTIILFIYGNSPIKQSSILYIRSNEENQRIKEEEIKTRKKYVLMRILGLILSILGIISSISVILF